MKATKNGNRIFLCGAFDFEGMLTGGQHTKTRELYYALCEVLGKENVSYVDTHNWKKNPIKLLLGYFAKAARADKIIMLPSSNGLKVFPQLLSLSKKLFGKGIYFDVIGGVLHEKVKEDARLKKILLTFDGIWVEGKTMEKSLKEQGFQNVTFLKNFKILDAVEEEDIVYPRELPLKLCTFSRVVKDKGITDAIHAVAAVNERMDRKIYELDIYGPVGEEYREEFEALLQQHKDCVQYIGEVMPNESVSVLKNYFLLLFPSYFAGEGMPGTVIDALAAGLPIVAARWRHSDMVLEGETGFVLPPKDVPKWADKLIYCYEHIDQINSMRICCRKEYEGYTKETVVKEICQLLSV